MFELFLTYVPANGVQFDGNDRAILEGQTEGFVKIHVKRGTDRIIGATIVGDGAGDMIRCVPMVLPSGQYYCRQKSIFLRHSITSASMILQNS